MVVPIDPTGIVEMPDDAGRRSPPVEARAQPLTVYWPGYSSRERLEAVPFAVALCAGLPLAVKLRLTAVPLGSPWIVTVTGTLLSCIGSSVVPASADGVSPQRV